MMLNTYTIRILNYIPVGIMLGFVGGVYYCYIYSVFIRISPNEVMIALGVIMHILFIISLICYFRCVFAEKSRIPDNFNIDSIPDSEKEPLRDEYVELDHAIAKITYCNKCQKYRPARAHHCSICRECILRYDHHCPWIGNCVGFHNHKYFILFLTYISLASLIVACSCCYSLSIEFDVWQTQLAITVGFASFLGVGGFAVFHCWMLSNNSTSVELRYKGFNVFNTGNCTQNTSSLCGESKCMWCIPIKSYTENGVKYAVRLRTKQGAQILIFNRYLI